MKYIKRVESEAYSLDVSCKQISWLGVSRLCYHGTRKCRSIVVSSVQGVTNRLDLMESVKSVTVCNLH